MRGNVASSRYGRQHLETAASTRTLLISSSIGSLIEWYDFFVFASAAALVLDRVFFPSVDARSGAGARFGDVVQAYMVSRVSQ